LGVPLVVDDLYSLDAESLAEHQPIRAFIFLFQWVPTHPDTMSGRYDRDFPGFFAHQVVNNACATLAVLNAIGNIPGLEMGSQLKEMMEFSAGMDPQSMGMVITSSDWLREAHNALSPPSSISLDDPSYKKTAEEAYHFVVYMPYMGSIYELDGLKEHPVLHGSYDEAGEGWVAKAR
jgi:ubiquitin carboxyl-terminal hydrolase L5